MKLSTTIGKIQSVPNMTYKKIIYQFIAYMKDNGSSDHHKNNNLKVVIGFSNFLGQMNTFYDVKRKEQVLQI